MMGAISVAPNQTIILFFLTPIIDRDCTDTIQVWNKSKNLRPDQTRMDRIKPDWTE